MRRREGSRRKCLIGRTGLREGRGKEGKERGGDGERGEEERGRCAPEGEDHSTSEG